MSYMTDDAIKRVPTPQPPRGSISFGGLLAVLFIGLKMTGAISWSWWLVLLPLWIGPAIVLLIVAIALLAAAL